MWYCWPIEEVKLEYPRVVKQVGGKTEWVEDKSATPSGKTVTTWRRDWKKGKVKSGPETRTYPREQVWNVATDQKVVTHYENDQRTGRLSKSGREDPGREDNTSVS